MWAVRWAARGARCWRWRHWWAVWRRQAVAAGGARLGTAGRSRTRRCGRRGVPMTSWPWWTAPLLLKSSTTTFSHGTSRPTRSCSAACRPLTTDAPSTARPPPARSTPWSPTTSCAGAWCCPAPRTWSWRAPRAARVRTRLAASCAACSSCSRSRSTSQRARHRRGWSACGTRAGRSRCAAARRARWRQARRRCTVRVTGSRRQ